jgi:hypothetical protein
MADNNFEKNMSMQMEEFKMHPSTAVWQKVDEQLRRDQRRRRFIIFSISAAAVLVGLFIYLGTPVNNSNTAKTTVNETTIPAAANETKKESVTGMETSTVTLHQPGASAAGEKSAGSNSNDQAIQQNNPPVQHQNSNATNDKQQSLTTATGLIKKKGAVASPVTVKNKQPDPAIKKSADAGLPVAANMNKPGIVKKQSTSQPVVTDSLPDKKPSGDNGLVITGKIEPAVQDTKLAMIADSNRIVQNENKVVPAPMRLNDSNTTNPPAVQSSKTAKKKWQYGFVVNAGAGSISNPRFGQAVVASYNSGSGTGVVPGISSGVITTKAYNANAVVQFGFGFVMRKEIFRSGFFSTGLQYQQKGFQLVQKQKTDSLVFASNTWVNFDASTTEKNYRYHYINIPTELQLALVQKRKGAIMFTAGIHHYLGVGNNVAAKRGDSLLYFLQPRYAATPAVDIKGSKVAFYQPVFYLSPVYNLAGKKSILQIGLYAQYGLLQVYRPTPDNHWWQTGINFRYYFSSNK